MPTASSRWNSAAATAPRISPGPCLRRCRATNWATDCIRLHKKPSYPRKRVSSTPQLCESIIDASEYWIARRSLSSGGHSADPLAGDDGCGYGAVIVSSRHCERSEAIHSSFTRRDGLLRGACHRARIRATRWLCAEHDRQLGGESLLSSLIVAKD